MFYSGASVFSQNASAAYVWLYNVTLTSASHYYDGVYDVWEIEWEDNLSTGSSYSDSQKKASWWSNSSNLRWEIGGARLSPALTALVAKKKVDILVNNANCSSNYGAFLQGVRVR